jgi:DNA-binding CsgD family transcriptional regulator
MLGLKMLQPRYISILQAQTESAFRDQVIKFGQSLGFQTVSAASVIDHSLTSTTFYGVGNTPAAYLECFDDRETWSRCPVMQHCKRSSIPIIWDQQTYVSRQQSDLWEQQAQHGYKTGIALALHMPGDRHFFIGVDRDKALVEGPRRLTRIVADLQLFAIHAQEAALRIFCPTAEDIPGAPRLTARELEALRWTMDGKLAWEVGEALNISERTAVFHLQNAVKKLGCSSKHQAVLKAIRLKLLV